MSVTAAAGFRAAGVACGIKPDGALDLALVVADTPITAVGLFTRNQAAAAPVELSRRHLADRTARAVVLNSGCANAGTGAKGEADALATAEAVARAIGCPVAGVVVCSTGLIGPPLPVARVVSGVAEAVAGLARGGAAGEAAATAILTTDSQPKQAVREADGWTVGGMAKGAGMLRPDMATMLAVITTDALVNPGSLEWASRRAADRSFNSLNVDGCESTNDSLIVLASGASGRTVSRHELLEGFEPVFGELAARMAADAEGASRVVRIRVQGASSDAGARLIGRAIADSALVRSSLYGGDPNWGRMLAAAGFARHPFDPGRFAVSYAGIAVARGGVGVPHDAARLGELLAAGDFTVEIEVGAGPGSADVLTCDLTPDYVRFNAEPS